MVKELVGGGAEHGRGFRGCLSGGSRGVSTQDYTELGGPQASALPCWGAGVYRHEVLAGGRQMRLSARERSLAQSGAGVAEGE